MQLGMVMAVDSTDTDLIYKDRRSMVENNFFFHPLYFTKIIIERSIAFKQFSKSK
jgi:hypothetical protein